MAVVQGKAKDALEQLEAERAKCEELRRRLEQAGDQSTIEQQLREQLEKEMDRVVELKAAKQRAQESRQHADEIVKKSNDLRQASHLLY